MVTGTSHFNIHPEVEDTFPCRSSNRITKEYYWFLVGEINRGTIKRAIHLFRYLCAKTDERILTTDKPIKVSFRQCEKLHICLSMSYNGKLYEREYYCTNFGVSIVPINNN